MSIVGVDDIGETHLIESPEEPGVYIELLFEMYTHVSRYTLPRSLQGNCTAYFFCYNGDSDSGGFPVVYADNNGTPGAKISSNEQWMDMDVSTPRWRSASFRIEGLLPEGAKVWFGFKGEYMVYPTFNDRGPDVRLMYDYYEEPAPVFQTDEIMELEISQYFTYHTPTHHLRNQHDLVGSFHQSHRYILFGRQETEAIFLLDNTGNSRSFFREIQERVEADTPMSRMTENQRVIEESPEIEMELKPNRLLLLILGDEVVLWDYPRGSILKCGEVLELWSRVTKTLELRCPL